MKKLPALTSYGLCISLWFFTGCSSSSDDPKPFDCSATDLAIELVTKVDPTSCTSNDGSITVSASGGTTPYTFSLNDAAFAEAASFEGLGSGSFTVVVKDKNGCTKSLDVDLILPGENPLSATVIITSDTECLTSNGTIEVTASGGTPPYQYKEGTGIFSDVSTFSGLSPGKYSVSVMDDIGCVFTINNVSITQGNTGISYNGEILAIFEAKCQFSGCHPDNGDWFTYSTAKANAALIKTKTGNGSMPKDDGVGKGGDLTSDQIKLIACWVDGGAPLN